MSVTDAFFEAVSGLTTTGATVLTGLDFLPNSILYYRAPGWVFALCYTIFGGLVLAGWYWVRPRPFYGDRPDNTPRIL
jgi:Trk-type K+ transport system membrane component